MSSRAPHRDVPAAEWTAVHYFPPQRAQAPAEAGPPRADGALRARRVAATRARRRRLVALDLALGLALALLVLVLAPGVAFAALLAVVGLAACAGSLLVGRLRRGG